MNDTKNELSKEMQDEILTNKRIHTCWILNLEDPEKKRFGDAIWSRLGYNTKQLADSELSGSKIIIHEDYAAFILKIQTKQKNPEYTSDHTVRFRHKNGTLVWWKCAASLLLNPEGIAVQAWINCVDVTEEKQVEFSLTHATRKLREIMFRLGDLVFVVDKNYIISEYHQNRDFELLFTPPSSFLNKHLSEIGLSDSDLREFIITINESKIEGRTPTIEFVLPVQGREEFYSASASSFKDLEGQLIETIFIAKNITEQKLTEVRLQELGLVGSKTTDLTIITDPSCLITWVNKAFEEHTGYTLEEISGKNPSSFLHGPETDPNTIELVDQAIKNRQPVQDTIINYAKDGRKYWVDFRIDPVFNEVGMCSHFISIERDTTSRKQAEAELALTRAFLLETNRVGKVGGWNYDVATDKVFWTDVTREIHELPEDFEPTVEKVIQFYKEGESRRKYFEVGMNAIQNGLPYDVELQIVTAKGKEIWIRAIGKVDFKNGVCTRLYGTFQDIDSFKKVEKELKESSALLRNLTDHVPGCLYQYELLEDGQIRLPYVSEGIFELTEFTSEEVRNNPSLIMVNIHPDDQKVVQEATRASFINMNQWQCDYRIITKSGLTKSIRGISKPQQFKEGVQWYGFLQEIQPSLANDTIQA